MAVGHVLHCTQELLHLATVRLPSTPSEEGMISMLVSRSVVLRGFRAASLPSGCTCCRFASHGNQDEQWCAGAAGAAQGRATLAGWGYGSEDIAEAVEHLHVLAAADECEESF